MLKNEIRYLFTFQLDLPIANLFFFFFFFWLHCAACGILVPRPGMEAGPAAVEARSPNRWTAREVLSNCEFWAHLLYLPTLVLIN